MDDLNDVLAEHIEHSLEDSNYGQRDGFLKQKDELLAEVGGVAAWQKFKGQVSQVLRARRGGVESEDYDYYSDESDEGDEGDESDHDIGRTLQGPLDQAKKGASAVLTVCDIYEFFQEQLTHCDIPGQSVLRSVTELGVRLEGLSTLIVIGFGSGDDRGDAKFKKQRELIVEWVRAGGRLLIHGERELALLLKEWFGTTWR